MLKKTWKLTTRYSLIITLLLLRPIIKRINWPLIIAVNAGSDEDIKSYAFPWIAKLFKVHKWYAIGFYKMGFMKFGIVVGSPYSNNEIRENPKNIQALIKNFNTEWNGSKYALTGTLTAYANIHGAWPHNDQRYTLGNYGTPYLIKLNIEDITTRHPELLSEKIAIIGYGFTGKNVARYLHESGYKISAFDISITEKSNYFNVSSEFSELSEYGIIVILTPNGNDGIDYIKKHISNGCVILSDTHPKIDLDRWEELKNNKIIGYECGSYANNYHFVPKLPRWSKDNMIGCVMQAVIECQTKEKFSSHSSFEISAKKMSILSRLEEPYKKLITTKKCCIKK